ncbi:MAG TPA: hypothetical protein PLV91_02620, partial [Verrucomicrobiota bacterium]|nr:hypothetical protein [Verrucomicrobiota bacterium]
GTGLGALCISWGWLPCVLFPFGMAFCVSIRSGVAPDLASGLAPGLAGLRGPCCSRVRRCICICG